MSLQSSSAWRLSFGKFMMITAVVVSGQSSQLDCTFPAPLTLLDNLLTVQQIINPINQTISVELTYQGEGWLAYGITDPSSSNHMFGSQIVLGLPDEDTPPQKWVIGNAYAASAVQPYPAAQQTLLQSSLVQENGVTTLSFTRKLNEGTSDELTIASGASQEFVFAVGGSNTFAQHANRGFYDTQVAVCTTATTNTATNNSTNSTNSNSNYNNNNKNNNGSTGTVSAPVIRGQVSAAELSRRKKLWTAHGILMMLAFGLCIPAAIAASLSRSCLPGNSWFYLHTLLNSTAIMCCLAGFGIAVHLIQVSVPGTHFKITRHRTVGLVVTIAIIVQGLLGVFRPHLSTTQHTDASLNDATENDVEGHGGTTASPSSQDKPLTKPDAPKSTVRKVWEILHRLLGLTILGLAWWNVATGSNLYYQRFSRDVFPNNETVFWIVGGCLLGLGVLVCLVSKLRKT